LEQCHFSWFKTAARHGPYLPSSRKEGSFAGARFSGKAFGDLTDDDDVEAAVAGEAAGVAGDVVVGRIHE
jgi:hypothetical protein